MTQEKIEYENIDDIVQSIFNFSNGDLRKSITLLQRSSYVANINKNILTNELILDTASLIPKCLVNELFETIMSKLADYNILTEKINYIFNLNC